MAKKKIKSNEWSQAEVTTLKSIFPSMRTADVAAKLGRSPQSVKSKALKMEIKKSTTYLNSIGKA